MARGRPKFIEMFEGSPDLLNELKDKVRLRKAAGWAETDIAAEIGITVPTLGKYFSSELGKGAMERKGEALDLLWESAKKGNVSAQKAMLSLTMQSEVTKPNDPKSKKSPVTLKLGKKALEQQAAHTAGEGTEWEDDIMPSGFQSVN